MTIAPIAPTIDPEPWPTTVAAGAVDNDPVVASIMTDRLRIALGVNDIVIRHLFSIGLSLHTTRTMVPDAARDRLDTSIDELDAAIVELRSLILDLDDRSD